MLTAVFSKKQRPEHCPGRVSTIVEVSLLAEAGDQSGEERSHSEQSKQGQEGSRLWQSVGVAVALIGGVSILICAGCRCAGSRLVNSGAAGRSAGRALIGSSGCGRSGLIGRSRRRRLRVLISGAGLAR